MIECEGEKVWEMEYLKLFDRKRVTQTVLLQRSMKAWSKRVVEIMFDSRDTGTLGYRKTGKGENSEHSKKGTVFSTLLEKTAIF